MSKTTKMAVLEETKDRLEKRIAEIRGIVWGPSPFMAMLELRKNTLAYIKSKSNEEMMKPENMKVLSDAVIEEKRLQKLIDEQKNCNDLIEELVKKEMELGDINMEIWRENRHN